MAGRGTQRGEDLFRRAEEGGDARIVGPGGLSPLVLVGRTPWSAADAPVGLPAPRDVLAPLFRQRDEGVRPEGRVRRRTGGALPHGRGSDRSPDREGGVSRRSSVT